MKQEFKCPNCGADLRGRETMYRKVICDDEYFGIEDNEIIVCDDEVLLAPPQPTYGNYTCSACDDEIDDYIYSLIDEDLLYE